MRLTRVHAQALTGDADRWLDALNNALIRWEISTPARVTMFLAQCAHESGGFKHLVENLHYSAAALLATWPRRFTPDEAVAMAYDEQRIGNRAYASRMGNGPEASGDGYRYRGRGIIQLTGRDNYARAGAAIGLDFVAQPELLETPDWAASSAGWFWATNGCNALADAGDYLAITKRINGGTNGLADRQAWLAKVQAILGTPSESAEIAANIPEIIPTPVAPRVQPQEEPAMGTTIALPLLAQLIPQVLGLFSGRAQATIAEKTGADPKLAADFMQSLIAQVGHAVSVPVVDNATATQAVAALTAAPPEDQAAKAKALEAQALATIDALIKAGDKAAQWDAAMWQAQMEGRNAAAARALHERWDMTPWLVWFAGIGTSLCSALMLVAIVYQSMKAEKGIDPVLLGLAGPLLAITYAAWKSIFDYRFDGTKDGTAQSQALITAAQRNGGTQ